MESNRRKVLRNTMIEYPGEDAIKEIKEADSYEDIV